MSKTIPALDRKSVLYWVGNSVWLTFAAASSTTYPFATGNGDITSLGIVQSLCFALSFFVIGIVARIKPIGRYTLAGTAAGTFVTAMTLVAVATSLDSAPLTYAASAMLAFGKACGFCQWLRVLALFSLHKAKWVLIMGSLSHILLSFGLSALPTADLKSLFVFGVCAPLGTIMMIVSVRTHSADLPHNDAAVAIGGHVIPQGMRLPIVCGVALTLITPIASSVFGGAVAESIRGALLTMLAHLCGLVLLAIIWFKLDRDVSLPYLYCVFLPLFASVAIVLPLVSSTLGWVVLFIGNGCYFLVSLLMVTTCLEFSVKGETGVMPLYGVFAGCMYLTDTVRLVVENLAGNGMLSAGPYVATMLLLYVLMIPAFFIVTPLIRKGRDRDAGDDSRVLSGKPANEDAQELVGTCRQIAQTYGLSKRQTEVMAHLATGRDVNHIAEALGLSPNTIRSYRKSLYATLGIHGRQDLLDLIEEYRANHSPTVD